ncbi:MAG: TIGR04282 family arsenosugar biosynthesis glycosyltransferase [Xanthobacteraceae bacterium]|nr:TIGR04282 family arsenosugar biosynthesis glycosyltransferase [Xanthobacteraceae bacterium]
MGTIAVAIVCKTPAPGKSKTRLSPPLRPEECAEISACFIRDLSRTIGDLASDRDVSAYALYTPVGTEPALRVLLPDNFALIPQVQGDFGERLMAGARDILAAGHDGVILVNSDSPTIPKSLLRKAVDAVARGNNVALSPAFDGGYTLIGLSEVHERLFEDIPWSTEQVYDLTCERAAEIGLPVEDVPGWYDVDDAESYRILENELDGIRMPFMTEDGGRERALATRTFVEGRKVKA